MTADRTHKERLFHAAAEMESEPQRAAFLTAACGNNESLRAEIDEMLKHDRAAGSFLDRPAVIRPVAIADDATIAEGPGSRIGPYRLMEKIGEGGFGLVFVAEQQEPVKRKVALKVIKPGMDSQQIIARFEAERQALALMDHPNIAKVLDAGATDSGRPYFVMELVRGIPITDYCEQNQLSPPHRLELFVSVCQAVQHAHQKGIIHRDIKPSNVLVTSHDGKPVVKVIDFGVAKAINQHLTERTIYTNFAQMLGTPLYMSPEQAEMSGLDIDTRSDIYSLGVLLYELLTDTTPFDKQRLRQAAFDEIRRIIREEEPPKPSTRMSTVCQAAATATEKCGRDRRKLSRLFRGELDWIVMKALEKDRDRRYESASAFAADVQHYLHDEPVLACPPSVLYRLRKLAQRRKRAVGVVALLLVVLLSLGVSSLLRWQRDLARAAQGQAETAERDARDLLDRAQKAEREVSIRAHLSRAAAIRQRGDVGQRFGCLAELTAALKLDPSTELRAEIRTEATAALALPDLEIAREWNGWPADTYSLDFDDSMQRYARLDKQGGVAVCRLTAGGEEVTSRIPAHGAPLFRGPWLSGDGRFVLVASGAASDAEPAKAFRVWRLDRPEPELVLDESVGMSVVTVAFRAGSQQLAIGHADRSVSIYDLRTGQRHRRLSLDSVPYHMEYHPHPDDGRLAIAAGSAVRIFDATTGQEHKPLRHSPGSSWASGLAWHPDGRRIATSCDTQIFFWDAAAATELTLPWEGHTTQGIHLAFNHAGDRLVSTDWAVETRIWDAVTGRLLLRSPGYAGLRFSRDDALLGFGHTGDKVRLYRVAPGRELRAVRHLLAGPKDQVGSPVLDADGRILAMGEENLPAGSAGRLSFFDLARGEELASVRLPANTFATPLGYHRRHGWLIGVAESGWKEDVGFWPCRFGPPDAPALRIGPPRWLATGRHSGSGLSADGHVLAVAKGNAGAVVLHLDEPSREVSLGPQHDVRTVAVSPDGRWVVTCSHFSDPRYKNARVWDAATGRHVHDLPADASTVAAFSPNGRWLASSSADLGCKLWEVETWRECRDFGRAQCAFSPDSQLLALNDVHGAIRLVAVDTGREVARLTFPETSRYRPVCFSPDSSHLIAVHSDRTALYSWDLRAIRRELAAMDLDWDWPAFAPAAADDKAAESLTVEVLAGDLGQATLTRESRARQAIERYRRAVAANPDSAQACNNLAWAYLAAPTALRDVPAALPLAEKAVRLTPDNAVYRNTLGLAFYRASRYREAVDVLRPNLVGQEERGLAFDLYVLAMSHYRLGEFALAKDYYDLAVRWAQAQRGLSAGELDELAAFRDEAKELLGTDPKHD